MGCATSKKAVLVTPAMDSSGILRDNNGSDAISTTSSRRRAGSRHQKEEEVNRCESSGELGKLSLKSASSVSVRLGNLHKYIEGEQVAAGWPAWLSAVAGEAIQGWVPLKADSFEKLEKVDKMKAHDQADKAAAEQRKEERKQEAETKKEIRKDENAEARATAQSGVHHATGGYGSGNTVTRTPVARERTIEGNPTGYGA